MRALVLSTTAVLLPILCVLGCKTTGRTKKMEYIQAYAGPRASDEDASLICIPRQLIKSVDGNTRYRLDVSGIDPREVLVMPGKHTVRLDARYYSRPPQTGYRAPIHGGGQQGLHPRPRGSRHRRPGHAPVEAVDKGSTRVD